MVLVKIQKNKKNGKDRRRPLPAAKHQGANHNVPWVTPGVIPKFVTMLDLLKHAGLPYPLLSIVHFTMSQMSLPGLDLDCAEYFAGVKPVTNGFRLWGAGGMGWFAPVCSTYVWVNRHTSGRAPDRPLGNTAVPSVRDANLMGARVCALLLILSALKVPWMLEQPQSSLFEHLPWFSWLCTRFNVFKAFLWMGAYGGTSPKPTVVYSNMHWVGDLYLPLPQGVEWDADVTTKYTDSEGVQRVCGGSGLKATQHYPTLFGRVVAELHESHQVEIRKAIADRQQHLESLERPLHMRELGWASACQLSAVLELA